MEASDRIDQYIEKNSDWRGELISRIRELIHETEPDIVEEWKWNSPVWSHHGMVCSASAFKKHMGLNFFRGAELQDKQGLFNSGLDSKKSRSIRWEESDTVNEPGLKALIREAIGYNASGE